MLSALMSALASLFNSTATLFTVDFYKRLRPQSSEQHLVNVGRLATAAVIVIGMVWIPFMQEHRQGPAVYLSAAGAVAARARDRRRVHARHLLAHGVTPKLRPRRPRRRDSSLGMLRLGLQTVHETQRRSTCQRSSRRSSTSTGCTSASSCSCSPALVIFGVSIVHAEGVGRAARGPDLQLRDRRAERGGSRDLRLLGDLPHLRDRRNHRRDLHLLLVIAAIS